MKLFQSPPSPFARMARMMVIECGLQDRVELIGVVARPNAPDPALVAVNPLGKIPALAREGASTIFDSRVICRFLDSTAGAGLYPEANLWQVLSLEALAAGILDSAVSMVYENRLRPAEKVSEDWITWQWQKVDATLDALERDWDETLFGALNAGQVATGAALGYLDFRHAPRNWRAGRDNLAHWFKDFSERPSMRTTAPSD